MCTCVSLWGGVCVCARACNPVQISADLAFLGAPSTQLTQQNTESKAREEATGSTSPRPGWASRPVTLHCPASRGFLALVSQPSGGAGPGLAKGTHRKGVLFRAIHT